MPQELSRNIQSTSHRISQLKSSQRSDTLYSRITLTHPLLSTKSDAYYTIRPCMNINRMQQYPIGTSNIGSYPKSTAKQGTGSKVKSNMLRLLSTYSIRQTTFTTQSYYLACSPISIQQFNNKHKFSHDSYTTE